MSAAMPASNYAARLKETLLACNTRGATSSLTSGKSSSIGSSRTACRVRTALRRIPLGIYSSTGWSRAAEQATAGAVQG
jgi:hypothetical protein